MLRSTGANRLDRVLISHDDIDHAGGLDLISLVYQTAVAIYPPEYCEHDYAWQWDGVTLRMLQGSASAVDNERSCTLLVTSAFGSAYLSGDIGHPAEAELAALLPSNVNLLLAPHHGSKGSSSNRFVRRLAPTIVIYSAGRHNRYGHPAEQVVQRYARESSWQLNTADVGAVQWCSDKPQRVKTHRQGWLNVPGAKLGESVGPELGPRVESSH